MDLRAPVVIEAAISPLRWDVPAQTVEEIVAEAAACLAAGAGIVHFHHDMRLDQDAAVEQLVATGEGIRELFPTALLYTDYLGGKTAERENAHLQPMAAAGVLSMFAIDPGITTFGSYAEDGLPTRTYLDGLRFDECHTMVELSKGLDVPVSLGVFEPGHLRWILAYEQRAGFSPGSVVKLYFGGDHMVDRPGQRGINFGLPGTVEALDVYLSMLRAAGSRLPFTVSLFGDPVLDGPLARAALERGGHLRVGAEDAAGISALTSAEMVAAAAALAADVGRPVATGADALAALRTGREVSVAVS
jgi:3-keto-5-aminohexanoate cleavage enzyme